MALFKRKKTADTSASDGSSAQENGKGEPKLSRDASGRLKPQSEPHPGEEPETGNPSGNVPRPPKQAPVTTALNPKIVQSVQLANTETSSYDLELATTPPEMMVGQVTGLAVQDAQNYMNAVMQIALAAQAVAIKKAAEGPVEEAKQIPFLTQIQGIVDHAVKVYGTVSETAGTSSKTVFSDLKSG
ncbi:hypothetical protein [Roseibium sediminis]|uniref:hypothetical protein n=1 Tax=Roseibium sediminis TaxID=1775174 RepID=UPI00123E26E2|nr:hypothetical protein [Roseibium sediminis]